MDWRSISKGHSKVRWHLEGKNIKQGSRGLSKLLLKLLHESLSDNICLGRGWVQHGTVVSLCFSPSSLLHICHLNLSIPCNHPSFSCRLRPIFICCTWLQCTALKHPHLASFSGQGNEITLPRGRRKHSWCPFSAKKNWHKQMSQKTLQKFAGFWHGTWWVIMLLKTMQMCLCSRHWYRHQCFPLEVIGSDTFLSEEFCTTSPCFIHSPGQHCSDIPER